MLGQLARRRGRLPTWSAAAWDGLQAQQTREMQIFEIFSKEKRAQRKAKLREEMQRGYFDDFRDFRDSKGKVFQATQRLIPASAAPAFPPLIEALAGDGTAAAFPPAGAAAPAATLVCVAFRAGAQEMIEAWAAPFAAAAAGAGPRAALVELALVESAVMGLWPFRSMLMRNGTKPEGTYAMPASYLFYFKDAEPLRAALHMTNRLTGYVYLVDGEGRVRWRGSGAPAAAEVDLLLRCTRQLLEHSESNSTGGGTEAIFQ